MTKQAVVDESPQTLENGINHDEKQNIWASILRDVKSSTKKAPATKSLVVLGDNESGRTTLVAKLQGNEDPKRGAGLEYHYIDVKDDDRDGKSISSNFKFLFIYLENRYSEIGRMDSRW